MGGEIGCCNPSTNDHLQMVHCNDELISNDTVNIGERRGQPTQRIAIKVNDLLIKEKGFNINEYQSLIEKVRNNSEVKNKKPLLMNVDPIPSNELPDAYYIVSSKCIYVGQWIYHPLIEDNVPGGIGRLYETNWIKQGYFYTDVLDILEDKENIKSQKENQSEGLGSTAKSFMQKINSFSKSATSISSVWKLQIQLNGIARKMNKNEEYEGNFIQGKLSGKGSHRIKNINYYYSGSWVNNQKHGKGLQQTKQTTYDGEFVKNAKEGNGTLIFHLDKQIQQKLHNEDIKFMSNTDGQQIKQITNELKNRQKNNKIIAEILKPYQWTNSFQLNSIFDDQQFLLERKLRQVFIEKYVGCFSNNEMHGRGIYQWSNGKTYHGMWNKGKIEGVGEFYWPDGVIYRGSYREDQKHGKGEVIWCDNRRFRGSWAFGIRHGYGELISIQENKLKIRGSLWKEDQQEKLYFENVLDMTRQNKLTQLRNRQNDESSFLVHSLGFTQIKQENQLKFYQSI